MKKRILVGCVAFALLAILTVGCSSTAPAPAPAATPVAAAAPPAGAAEVVASEPSGDEALLTFYRKKRVVGMALNTSVYVDGVEVAELDPGTYAKVRVQPGEHIVWADEEKDAITITAEPGATLYFRMELVPGLWKGHGKAVHVDAATGAAELAEYQCKLTDEIKVPAMVVQ